MAVAVDRLKEFDQEWNEDHRQWLSRRYRVGAEETLAGASLEEGDTITDDTPGDATYYITESRVDEDMSQQYHNTAKVVAVTAFRYRAWG